MLGNGVVGILSETSNKWERRVPLTPSHCARLLYGGRDKTGVTRIIVQPSTKRIHHDRLYQDVGCEISDDLSECGLILGIKQPKPETILPDRAYAFFSHTHKAQMENMPLLDKIISERVSLYDYELIVGDRRKRLLSFGKFAGRAGLIDFLHGLGQRYLSLGFSTPFLSLGRSYMYSSLAAAKAAVISVGEEIATLGLPSGICPLVFVFTGSGNVSIGAQEIFKLLPHTFVEPSKLQELFGMAGDLGRTKQIQKRVFQIYGSVVSSEDMVEHICPTKEFNKEDYYAHPENYKPIFHEKIAPYASVIVNCMYWEKRFPRLLSNKQLQSLMSKGCPLVGIADITCDLGGSLEFVNQTTSIDYPFFRYDPLNDSYHHDLEGSGLICLAIDILPAEFSKEASQQFGDILSQFVGFWASTVDIMELPAHLRRACIVHKGALTSLYEYIPRVRKRVSKELSENISGLYSEKKYKILVSLNGHLFDQFLINEALDIIEAAGGSFNLVKCQVGRSADDTSYSELEVGSDHREVLDKIIDSLNLIASSPKSNGLLAQEKNKLLLKVGRVHGTQIEKGFDSKKKITVLILGAGRVCQPAAELLVSNGSDSHPKFYPAHEEYYEEQNDIEVIVASLFLKDAEEITDSIPNTKAVQLDVMDKENLHRHISQVEVVISLLPPSFHLIVANACIELGKHLVTASYIDDSISMLDEKAKIAGVTIIGEMGLDPGIDHMIAMKMIDDAHLRKGSIKSFISYCGGLPSPAAANNPLAYKFSWNPAGALRAGSNPATYRYHGKTIHIDGSNLYDSAEKLRLPDLPAFALECIPNRNSLVYGDVYRIGHEASTIFRGTLRYEGDGTILGVMPNEQCTSIINNFYEKWKEKKMGFGKIMGTMARMGLLETNAYPFTKNGRRSTVRDFLLELLKVKKDSHGTFIREEDIREKIVTLGLCNDQGTAAKVARTIMFLGLHEPIEIPPSCENPFSVTCSRMEERLTYSNLEQDMVLLHHEVEVDFSDGQPPEKHTATLLEFGRTEKGKTTMAMALTVGIPAAIGALLLIRNKVKTRGVLRPTEPEVYVPALHLLEACGFKLMEKTE